MLVEKYLKLRQQHFKELKVFTLQRIIQKAIYEDPEAQKTSLHKFSSWRGSMTQRMSHGLVGNSL